MSNFSTKYGPLLIEDQNISKAWSRIVEHILKNTGTEITPLILSLTSFDETGSPLETPGFSEELDKIILRIPNARSIEDVAYTIFPKEVWNVSKNDRHVFFKTYLKVFNHYKYINLRENRGSYFERLINYGPPENKFNQLEWIITKKNSRKGVRRSMFQATIFDPLKDHNGAAQIQFPCMQNISFEPTKQGLVVNAFYATQQLLLKGYGNYLGISRLGAFMAKEMNTTLFKVNIFVGVAKLEKIKKNDVQLRALLKQA